MLDDNDLTTKKSSSQHFGTTSPNIDFLLD